MQSPFLSVQNRLRDVCRHCQRATSSDIWLFSVVPWLAEWLSGWFISCLKNWALIFACVTQRKKDLFNALKSLLMRVGVRVRVKVARRPKALSIARERRNTNGTDDSISVKKTSEMQWCDYLTRKAMNETSMADRNCSSQVRMCSLSMKNRNATLI